VPVLEHETLYTRFTFLTLLYLVVVLTLQQKMLSAVYSLDSISPKVQEVEAVKTDPSK